MVDQLSQDERTLLLKFARQALEAVTSGTDIPPLDLKQVTPRLLEPGATFVTLTRQGELRGCIGALEPLFPLVEDVRQHAVAAATQDFRFPPLQASELKQINIEISRLTLPQNLEYDTPKNLLLLLRPGVDGVILRDGINRATFLPQVWEKLPEPEQFLAHLCMKMGASPDLWRHRKLHVQVYQVEEFHE